MKQDELHRKKGNQYDYLAEYKDWKFTIVEYLCGKNDFVYKIYVENKFIHGVITFKKQYTTLIGAKTAVAKFLLKECNFRL